MSVHRLLWQRENLALVERFERNGPFRKGKDPRLEVSATAEPSSVVETELDDVVLA